ncbi:MAG: hypothetical protein WCB49_05295, partial [Gammaproteobacteria bacterium]
MRRRSILFWAAAATLAGVVAGCAVAPSGGPGAGVAQARRLESRGNYQKAGAAWLQLAKQARGQARETARLNAATDYEKAGDLASAWEAVAPLDISALAPMHQFTGALTKARLALATHRPQP